jgi:hypothetical protein
MSHFRQQFEQARRDYLSIRYPGNLVRQVQPPAQVKRWVSPLLQTSAAAAAIAAVVMLAVWLAREPVQIDPPPAEVVHIEPEQTFVLAGLPAIEVPQLYEDFDPAFEAPSIYAPIPTFTFISDDDTSTTREAA